tara:strand:+ start:594 stop:1043 length:450 start_codon:yes stop_codon:yes gene_type:complete
VRIRIIAAGRMRRGVEHDLYEHYRQRLRWEVDLREIDDRKTGGSKEREGEAILAVVRNGSVLVALDERGRDMASDAMANKIGAWRDTGISDLAFAIGGADGLSDQVRQEADLMLSFGSATWPHLLVRGMLAEQLYRSQQILAGHPYHRA